MREGRREDRFVSGVLGRLPGPNNVVTRGSQRDSCASPVARVKQALHVQVFSSARHRHSCGYRLDVDGRTLVAVDGEQATIARARALVADGCGLRGFAAQLAAEGHVNRTGRAFAAVQVARMLDRGERAAAWGG